ncbi:MAG: hypothetical protein ACYTEO_19860 [Planctomycetota bacterium]
MKTDVELMHECLSDADELVSNWIGMWDDITNKDVFTHTIPIAIALFNHRLRELRNDERILADIDDDLRDRSKW